VRPGISQTRPGFGNFSENCFIPDEMLHGAAKKNENWSGTFPVPSRFSKSAGIFTRFRRGCMVSRRNCNGSPESVQVPGKTVQVCAGKNIFAANLHTFRAERGNSRRKPIGPAGDLQNPAGFSFSRENLEFSRSAFVRAGLPGGKAGSFGSSRRRGGDSGGGGAWQGKAAGSSDPTASS